MDAGRPMHEYVALVALLRTCERLGTRASIANDCVPEGSAERLLLQQINPAAYPLQRYGRPVIINRRVLDNASWTKALEHNPGVYVVKNMMEVGQTLDDILDTDSNVDSLIQTVLAEETATI